MLCSGGCHSPKFKLGAQVVGASVLITDFYKEDEIVIARNVLGSFCDATSHLPKLRGHGKGRITIEDIIKTITNPAVELPVFYAVDLSRLPPVDVTHCNVWATLKELQI